MERVKVFLRVKGEKRDGAFMFSENSVIDKSGMYDFDKIFYGKDQTNVFQSLCPLITMALSGYSTTVFTYGQTGSGKTYTMEGTADSPGLIPLTIKKIFDEKVKNVTISVIEIYNEKIFDLLSLDQINVRESSAGIVLDRIQAVECPTLDAAMGVFNAGIKNRRTDCNEVNSRSSRSHMVFTISLAKETDHFLAESKITLVDLAGSEKLSYDKHGRSERENARGSGSEFLIKKQKTADKSLETSNINKSLLCLSRIISTLSADSKAKYINYRDSKLTFLLRDSLSQNSNLAIIGAVQPEDQAETKSTIGFLSTAKKIKLSPELKTSEKTAEKLINQIKALTAQNHDLKDKVNELLEKQSRGDKEDFLKSINSSLEEAKHLMQRIDLASKAADKIKEQLSTIKAKNNELGFAVFNKMSEMHKQNVFSELEVLQDIKTSQK
ncbi:hypothetical protein NEAUS03_2181 [Nematocida ausubeli]|uniref:Kinesin-like protein n=1 Tax=Nematocida ausubeli (strain ATCC PRA-371 / ERTm2) TaxID=1913371 RepID=H8ZAT8_NEMA1|nr:hypothetical protein NERG_00687 [Nematocida ausubeli]KAI5163048.1 hypothetical protein NEAUS03_2181 [Nematocida ausubeli]